MILFAARSALPRVFARVAFAREPVDGAANAPGEQTARWVHDVKVDRFWLTEIRPQSNEASGVVLHCLQGQEGDAEPLSGDVRRASRIIHREPRARRYLDHRPLRTAKLPSGGFSRYH